MAMVRMRRLFLRVCHSIVIALAGTTLGTSVCAASQSQSASTALFALIDALSRTPPVNRAFVENLIRARLEVVDETDNDVFRSYEARNLHVGNSVFDLIEYREPVPHRGATAGPILILYMGQDCIARTEVLSKYRELSFGVWQRMAGIRSLTHRRCLGAN